MAITYKDKAQRDWKRTEPLRQQKVVDATQKGTIQRGTIQKGTMPPKMPQTMKPSDRLNASYVKSGGIRNTNSTVTTRESVMNKGITSAPMSNASSRDRIAAVMNEQKRTEQKRTENSASVRSAKQQAANKAKASAMKKRGG